MCGGWLTCPEVTDEHGGIVHLGDHANGGLQRRKQRKQGKSSSLKSTRRGRGEGTREKIPTRHPIHQIMPARKGKRGSGEVRALPRTFSVE